MASSTWHKVFGALAAAATAISSAGPAMAQAAAHGHDAATPHQLSLDQGRKWVTDDALRNGMDRIRGLVEPRLGDAHAGKLTATQYRELATQIETEVGGIVANCKLEPKADAMLHLVIAELARWHRRDGRPIGQAACGTGIWPRWRWQSMNTAATSSAPASSRFEAYTEMPGATA